MTQESWTAGSSRIGGGQEPVRCGDGGGRLVETPTKEACSDTGRGLRRDEGCAVHRGHQAQPAFQQEFDPPSRPQTRRGQPLVHPASAVSRRRNQHGRPRETSKKDSRSGCGKVTTGGEGGTIHRTFEVPFACQSLRPESGPYMAQDFSPSSNISQTVDTVSVGGDCRPLARSDSEYEQ